MVFLFACKPQTPKQFIQPAEMEDILVEYHLAMAMADETDERAYNQEYYLESILKAHGVTKADFDSSMVYYYNRADRFDKMYKSVTRRLEEKALSLGATEGEIGKFSTLNTEGDTANIWSEKRSLVMRPMPPYNRFDFTVTADSTFRRGDSFLMQFVSDFVYQDGRKDGIAYVAVDYPDTVVCRQASVSYSGLFQIRIEPNDTADIQRIRGFFYLGGAHEQTTTQRLLFINSIQLIRFHKQHEPEIMATDSVAPSADAQRSDTDTVVRRDTLRHRGILQALN